MSKNGNFPKYMKAWGDWLTNYETLDDAQFGRLMRAFLGYVCQGQTPLLPPKSAEEYLFLAVRQRFDKDIDDWRAGSYAKSEAGKKGADKRWGKDGKSHADNGKSHADNGKNGKEKEKDKEKEKESINHLQSFIQSKAGRDDDEGLERLIESLQLDLYENGPDWPLVKQIKDTIRVMWRRESVRVNGDTVPRDEVRLRLKALKLDHIDRILATLADMDPEEPVTNGQAYLMACIYNAPADCAVNNKRASWR